MTDGELLTIGKLCDALRSRGVKFFEGGGVKIEFSAPVEVGAELGPQASLPSPTDACRCGHPLHQHPEAVCLLGCPPEACINPEVKG